MEAKGLVFASEYEKLSREDDSERENLTNEIASKEGVALAA
jgi:hypothetical protein